MKWIVSCIGADLSEKNCIVKTVWWFAATTFFNEDIKDSTDDDDDVVDNDIKKPTEDDYTEVATEMVLNTMHDDIKKPTEDDYTEVAMEMVLSPIQARKSHMITCPVCYEISILKLPKLYDNLISACMEKSSNKQ